MWNAILSASVHFLYIYFNTKTNCTLLIRFALYSPLLDFLPLTNFTSIQKNFIYK